MDRYEREELAELFLRVVRTTVEATSALYTVPLSMAEWSRSADNEKDARREFWEALYRLEVEDTPQKPLPHVRIVERQATQH